MLSRWLYMQFPLSFLMTGYLRSSMTRWLDSIVDATRSGCTECGACRTQCVFLQRHGLPGEIARRCDSDRAEDRAVAFGCSLCDLCAAVCPEELQPAKMFLALRQQAVASGEAELSPYKPLLRYERIGGSRLFSYYGLPNGCDTLLFPGCALPGTRPQATWQLFAHLRRAIPRLGIGLDCCYKPSHDLGRRAYFVSRFADKLQLLKDRGVRKVLVACPNCYHILQEYGDGLVVETVYELMDREGIPAQAGGDGRMALHDPCPLRWNTAVHDAVRSILHRIGVRAIEMKHRRKLTLCCGEGGGVGLHQPELARSWQRIRGREAEERPLLTYCAGCAGFLSQTLPTLHILDLLFDPQNALRGESRPAQSPWTYIHRLRLKWRFKKAVSNGVPKNGGSSGA